MIDRQRLIPAVILGAMGLLALKAISWTGDFTPLAEQVAPRSAHVGPDGSYNPDDFKGVTRIWARAREPYVLSPDVTGSVPAKDAKAPEAKGAEAKGAPASPTGAVPTPAVPTPAVPAPAAPANAARDRTSVMNQGERPMSPAEKALVERIGQRRDEMELRIRELDLREKLLETAERKLDGRVGELKAVEEKLDAKKDEKEGAESQGLKKLVIMYENMKPRDAARVFDRLPPDVLVPMVLQMNPRKMSEVMASMTAEAAEKLTVGLSQRAQAARGDVGMAAAPAALPSTELPAVAPAGAQPARRP